MISNLTPCSWQNKYFLAPSSSSLPDVGEAVARTALDVVWVGDSQTHGRSYIYWINDTLHPPHNSCLLHLAWLRPEACFHLPSAVIERLGQLYVSLALLMLEINADTHVQKQNTCSDKTECISSACVWEKSVPFGLCFFFFFLLFNAQLNPPVRSCLEGRAGCF